MTTHTRDVLIGLTWLIEFVIMQGLAVDTFQLARKIDGRIRWPIAGRYLLALAFQVMAIRALDVTRIRIKPVWMEPVVSSNSTSYVVLVIRLLVPLALIFVWWRIRHGGLVRGRVSSVPETTGEVVYMRRKDDWEAEA